MRFLKNVIFTIGVIALVILIPLVVYTVSVIECDYNTNVYIESQKTNDNTTKLLMTKLNSGEFFDGIINTYIDSKVNEYRTLNLKNDLNFIVGINSHFVNDRILGIEVTTDIIGSKNIKRTRKGFNFNMESKTEIKLEDLFDSEYKSIIEDYSENYLLTKKYIIFIEDDKTTKVKYKELKEYNNSYLLTSKNLGLTDNQYNKLMESK